MTRVFVYFQRELLNCLVFGLISKCNRLCVRALTVCALENEERSDEEAPENVFRTERAPIDEWVTWFK